jgi:hypothetical protein
MFQTFHVSTITTTSVTFATQVVLSCLIATVLHALLVVARGAVVRVDRGVRGNAVGIARLSPGVDGVHVTEQSSNVVAVRIEGEHRERLLELHEAADGLEPETRTEVRTSIKMSALATIWIKLNDKAVYSQIRLATIAS